MTTDCADCGRPVEPEDDDPCPSRCAECFVRGMDLLDTQVTVARAEGLPVGRVIAAGLLALGVRPGAILRGLTHVLAERAPYA